MAAIVRANFPQSLLPFVGKWAGEAFKNQDTVYDKIFEVFAMDTAFEQDVMSAGSSIMPALGENQAVQFDTLNQHWTYWYTAYKCSSGFIISEEALDDSKYHKLGEFRTKETTKAINVTKETLAANVLNLAFSSSLTYGDGKALIDNAHPIYRGANISNRPSSYVDLSETALEQAVIDIKDIRDETGNRMQLKIEKLIVPKESVFEAHRILKSTLQYNTAENNANALKDMGLIPEILSWNYLTDADAWFLQLDAPEGLKWGNRGKTKIKEDNDFATSANRYKFSFRFAVGATNSARCIYGSQGV
jgi:hypothetical protein